MKVSQCQSVKETPDGCTHVMLNMIGEVYDWFKLDKDVAMVFFREWTNSYHEKGDLLESSVIIEINNA